MPDEPFDIYVDQFVMGVGVYGATLNFSLSPPFPGSPGSAPLAVHAGTVRMSLEHAKVMAFMMARNVRQAEDTIGRIPVPNTILNQLIIAPEDWTGLGNQDS